MTGDVFAGPFKYLPDAVDQLAFQMDTMMKYNAVCGREPVAAIPLDEADRFVKWAKENS